MFALCSMESFNRLQTFRRPGCMIVKRWLAEFRFNARQSTSIFLQSPAATSARKCGSDTFVVLSILWVASNHMNTLRNGTCDANPLGASVANISNTADPNSSDSGSLPDFFLVAHSADPTIRMEPTEASQARRVYHMLRLRLHESWMASGGGCEPY